jgi:hypothetical protein
MVTTALNLQRDALSWLSPSPTWGGVDLGQPANREEFLRPAILRFANDAFMDDLLNVLAYRPDRLREWRAVPETWDKPMRTPPTAAPLALAEPISKLSVRLSRLRALPPATTALATQTAPTVVASAAPLKLYQPIQQRHYMITASLVCQRPGLPDRRLDPTKQERAAYVLRRIMLPDGADAPAADSTEWDEYAFVIGPTGPSWQRVDKIAGRSDRLLTGEERLPLFSLGYDQTPDHKRRVFGAVIPVGRREAYLAARVKDPLASSGDGSGDMGTSDVPPVDPRALMFQMQVTGPWRNLVEQSLDEIIKFEKTLNLGKFFGDDPPTSFSPDAPARTATQEQTISWYALLDFERFLNGYLPRVHDVLAGKRDRTDLNGPELQLLEWLEGLVLSPAVQNALGAQVKHTLAEALALLAQTPAIGVGLEAVDVLYDASDPNPDPRWPSFRFPLASSLLGNTLAANTLTKGPFPFTVEGQDMSGRAATRQDALDQIDAVLQALDKLVEGALPAIDPATAAPELPIDTKPQLDSRAAWFAIRCVYERPNCGPFDPPIVSEPTTPFQMAGFFDPEAPVRPVRLPMPFDISPAGLRKFPKGATLMISDMLCGQLKRIRQLTLGDLVLSVLPWPFHKDLPSVDGNGPCADSMGEFCSLSIPIVTLAALILLIIIVALFDLFFHWLPFLFFCFPLKLSGKRNK